MGQKKGMLRSVLSLLPFFAMASVAGAKNKTGTTQARMAGAYRHSGIPYYRTPRTKFKGWMREKKRSSFNKNK